MHRRRFLSSALQHIALLALSTFGFQIAAFAHNLPHTFVEVERLDDQTLEVRVHTHVAAYILDLPLEHLNPRNLDTLTSIPEEQLVRRANEAKVRLRNTMYIEVDGVDQTDFHIEFPEPGEIRRHARAGETIGDLSVPIRIQVHATRASNLVFAAPRRLGPVVLAVRIDGALHSPVSLSAAETSNPISLVQYSHGRSNFVSFAWLGITHIVPKGLDHILFIISLAIIKIRPKHLFWQVTGFTLAHSLTLGLTISGSLPNAPDIIEPLISMSIVAMAALNALCPSDNHARGVLIIALGLLHGLGFASVLQSLGLPEGQELLALAAFNVGVEVGQIFVLTCVLAFTVWHMHKAWFFRTITLPLSLIIAIIGSLWTFERIGAIL